MMDPEPAPSPLTTPDVALLRAARVWGGAAAPGLWDRFRADWRASLKWGWEAGLAGDPASARARLRAEHAAQTRPDLARVHANWWVRALRNEPRSVQRAVVAGLPPGVAEALRDGLGLAAEELRPDRSGHPAAARIALALWTVRLVGDVPERDDDPPVIAALTRLDAHEAARLIHMTGLAKWCLTDRPVPPNDPRDEARIERLRQALAGVDPRFLQVAVRDVARLSPGGSLAVARAGMITFARLLGAAEPYRARWALQHIPYTTARSLLSLMGPLGRRTPMLARWESEALRAAWQRLSAEDRISVPWSGQP